MSENFISIKSKSLGPSSEECKWSRSTIAISYNRVCERFPISTLAWRRKAGSFRLCVWPWPVSHYISKRIAAAPASKSRRRTNAERSGRVGWRRVNTQTRSDPSRMQLCSPMGCAARIFLSFLFSPGLPIGERVFVRRKDARRLSKSDQANQSVTWLPLLLKICIWQFYWSILNNVVIYRNF